MPNFLEPFPPEPPEGEREKTVIAVGRVTEVKRFDLLVEQFIHMHERVPGWKLKLIGDGEDMPKLRQLVEKNGADYVELAGQMDNALVSQEMARAAIFAMSSRSEGLPFVLLEAQSCALPIVAYDVRVGPGFVVQDGRDGYLVPEGDRAQYEDRLAELMNSPAKRAEMGRQARLSADLKKGTALRCFAATIG